MLIKITAIILTILLGLCVGSFLNVVIYRLPQKMSLAKPGSHCPTCKQKIKWYDNIPLLSYIFLLGKCRNCKHKISIRYPLVELLNAALWFLSLMANTNLILPDNKANYLLFVIHCLIYSVLICVFFCDFDNLEIPDELQIALLILGLIGLLANGIDVKQMIYGFIVGGGFFLVFSLLFFAIRKREGLGFGDVKLMAVLGLILGLSNTILTIILSAVIGAIVLSILMIKNKGDKNKEYPFATFIVPCAIFAMLAGNIVVDWYLSLFVAL